jgi:hypothetical protein
MCVYCLESPCVVRLDVQYTDIAEVIAPFLDSGFIVDEWVPRNDLLAHGNLAVFVSHGGFNGVTEAAYHGVPTIVVSGLGDQVSLWVCRFTGCGCGWCGPLPASARQRHHLSLPASTQVDNFKRVVGMGTGTGFPLAALTNHTLYLAVEEVRVCVGGGGGSA